MNIALILQVSFLFKDVTIGNAITVELVGIRMLKNDDFSNEYSQGNYIGGRICKITKVAHTES